MRPTKPSAPGSAPASTDAVKGSVKEAIGKLIGDRQDEAEDRSQQRALAAAAALMALAGCSFGPRAPQLGPDGQPLPVAYRISARDNAEIPTRLLTQVNLLRAQSGMAALTLSPPRVASRSRIACFALGSATA